MKQERIKKVQWFIEPLNNESNDKVGALLATMQMTEDVFIGLPVKIKGRPARVNVFGASPEIIEYFRNSPEHQKLEVRIWRQEAGSEPEIWNFPKKSHGRRN